MIQLMLLAMNVAGHEGVFQSHTNAVKLYLLLRIRLVI